MKVKSIIKAVAPKLVDGTLPDIDTDFCKRDRVKIKSYMEQRSGKEQVCSVGTLGTIKIKGFIRDFGKIISIPKEELAIISKIVNNKEETLIDIIKRAAAEPRIKRFLKENTDLLYSFSIVEKQPKIRSIHACAVIIFPKILKSYEWCPVRVQNGLMITEWDGYQMDAAGFLKDDILGLIQLDKFTDILNLIKNKYGKVPDIYNLPYDSEVYRYFSNGWNGDVFQLGTEGLTNYTRALSPQSLEDLIATVAIYRPGPMQNHYHEIYVKCKNEGRKPEYLWGTKEITKNTFGLIIYQEQVMKVFQQLGGLSMKEADDVRRAMGKKKLSVLMKWKDRVEKGFLSRGASKKDFDEVWNAVQEFAKYGFNRCLSGKTRLRKMSYNKKQFNPTIEEMYKIKNDKSYAISIGKLSLHEKYKKSYPKSWSLNENNRLVKNDIKDIRYEGYREVFELTLCDGRTIKTTDNHKFPTTNGEKLLRDIDIENDLIYSNGSYCVEDTGYRFGKNGINSEKGKQGFQKRDTDYTKLIKYITNDKKSYCEKCGRKNSRLEVHHIDNNHGNNDVENLITLCCSCHKKSHYKIGRTKAGEKGSKVSEVKIKSIKSCGKEDVYDVEMFDPYHTFTIDNGIITCNSHATAYAMTAYICMYLKVHYPIEFWTTALYWASDKIVPSYLSEIFQAKSVSISSPNINLSEEDMFFNTELKTIFWGIGSIKGIGEDTANQIILERRDNGEYKNLTEFIERHNFKGSKVKKQTYEALITSGAFDDMYDIKDDASKRFELIELFRDFKKVKIAKKAKDKYSKIENKNLDKDWWWLLNQKDLTGLALIDYKKIAEKFNMQNNFLSNNEANIFQYGGLFRNFGGYVVEYSKGKSKRGKFARIAFENNYKIHKMVIWSEEFEKFEEQLKDCEKSFILFSANIKYVKNKWMDGNQFTLCKDSVLQVLK